MRKHGRRQTGKGAPALPHGGLVARPGGDHVPVTGRVLVKLGEWLTGNHVPAVGDGWLSPAAHRAKRDLYLQLLTEARRGAP